MRRRLPPLYSLRAFEAAARLSGFTKASEELNVTPAAIAHQIKNLEANLDVQLFDRHHRGVSLNPAGKDYLSVVNKILDELTRETQIFKSRHRKSPIRLAAFHIVSDRLLLPAVQVFLQEEPDVRAELIADIVPPDFRSGNVDIIIWYGEKPPEGTISQLIMEEELTPVCSPDFVEDHGGSLDAEKLRRSSALYDLYWKHDWSDWLEAAGLPDLENTLGFSLYSMMIKAAEEGNGIAIGHTGLLKKELSEGTLIKPFPLSIPSRSKYYAITTEEILQKKSVQAFWDWLARQIENGAF